MIYECTSEYKLLSKILANSSLYSIQNAISDHFKSSEKLTFYTFFINYYTSGLFETSNTSSKTSLLFVGLIELELIILASILGSDDWTSIAQRSF